MSLRKRQEILFALIFIIIAACLNLAASAITAYIGATDSAFWPRGLDFWPIGIGHMRLPSLFQIGLGIFTLFAFGVVTHRLQKMGWPPLYSFIACTAFIFLSNLCQGYSNAFITPITGFNIEYWNDAVNVESAWQFLSQFNEIQQDLFVHSRTHPPGPVLMMYGLLKIGLTPAGISIVITFFSCVLTFFYFLGIGRTIGTNDLSARYLAYLLLCIPAIQIYYCASIDALFAGCLLGFLYHFLNASRWQHLLLSVLWISFASFISFGFLFIIPVTVIFEWITRKSILRSLTITVLVSIVYYLLKLAFDFNYLEAFVTASKLENPDGFRLFARPFHYVYNRAECVAEILLFLGPFALLNICRGFKINQIRTSQPQQLLLLGVGTLLVMFATGAYRVGETARACIFIYPFLLFALLPLFQNENQNTRLSYRLAYQVFAQGILMQLFGTYLW